HTRFSRDWSSDVCSSDLSAVQQDLGFTLATSQSIWPDHPEKVLGCTREFVEQYPNTARALVMAILEASRFIEESPENRRSTAQRSEERRVGNASRSRGAE